MVQGDTSVCTNTWSTTLKSQTDNKIASKGPRESPEAPEAASGG